MTQTLRHRGPDECNVISLGSAALGHTRLSIIDLTATGRQPMQSDDGRYTVVYNGEVYNFPALRERLEGLGVSFRGRSDTEVVLRSFERWQTDALVMLNGMFAVAVWDAHDRRLCLARDRFGIKPLYYSYNGNGIVFGSEIKALLASGFIERRVSGSGLAQYLYYGNATGTHTLFEGVHQLEAGAYLLCNAQDMHNTRFWRIESVEQQACTLEAARPEIRTRLERAVASHLISDVPVGVFLSGGIDSSAITALGARHYGGVLKTYSVGFDFDRGVNELPRARRVAEQFQTDHHELHVRAGDISRVIEKLVCCHDQPFADAANIPLYLLCEQLAGAVKVILQGDGGDEIFAGYRRHGAMSMERLWRCVGRVAVRFDGLVPRSPPVDRVMRFFRLVSDGDPALRLALLFTPEVRVRPPERVLSASMQEMIGAHDPFERYRELYERLRRLDPMQRVLYADTMGMMIDTYMEKVDKSTMAHGIEVRVPFLDNDLTDYVLGLPASVKVRRGRKKVVLRAALRGVLPDEVLDGPKRGFGVPYGYWLRGPLAGYLRSVVLDRSVEQADLFERSVVERLISEHVSGRRDHGFLLYKLLNLALWWNRYMERSAAGASSATSVA